MIEVRFACDAKQSSVSSSQLAASAHERRYRYSNLGYWLAGAVQEQATGRAFATLVVDRLMAPLGLTAAEMSVALPDGQVLARGHLRRFGPVNRLLRLLCPWQIDRVAGRWVRVAPLLMTSPVFGGAFARAEAYLRAGST